MNLEKIAEFAKIKGLQVLGTGDFTHPKWLEDIRHVLVEDSASTLYTLKNEQKASSYFMITGEVSTIYSLGHEVKKIHHVILTPDIETAIQINAQLKKYGDLSIDGRPILKMTSPHLVELIMEISPQNLVFPAHIWTPWFSVLGAFSGFDSIKDCYQDMTKHIYALETGLSSDPQMNWRLSNFDKFTLLSNSDCHSFLALANWARGKCF